MILRYLRWGGTNDEFKEYVARTKSVFDGIKGVALKGVYEPLSEWDYVFLFEADNNEKFLEALHMYVQKHGSARANKITLIKAELLYPYK